MFYLGKKTVIIEQLYHGILYTLCYVKDKKKKKVNIFGTWVPPVVFQG